MGADTSYLTKIDPDSGNYRHRIYKCLRKHFTNTKKPNSPHKFGQTEKVNPFMEVRVLALDGSSAAITVNPTMSVMDLKQRIALVQRIEPAMHLVFAGNLLSDTDQVGDTGLFDGCLIQVVPIQDSIIVMVITPLRDSPLTMSASRTDSASLLKMRIAQELSIDPDSLKLVCQGRVLEGELSLAYFGVMSGSTIRIVVKHTISRATPSKLIDTLYRKVSELLSAPPKKSAAILDDISQLIENNVLQAYAKVDSDARHLVDDALMILESADIPIVWDASETVAAMNDLTMTIFEETSEGMRLLEDLLLTEPTEKPLLEFPTTIPFDRKISDTPLPTWWCNGRRIVDRIEDTKRISVKDRYRREIRALKKLGINDESAILTALKETSGNLPMAARILVKNSERKV